MAPGASRSPSIPGAARFCSWRVTSRALQRIVSIGRSSSEPRGAWRLGYWRSDVARSLDDILAALPTDRRARIEARAAELIEEVEGLKAVRKLAVKTQEQIAHALC